MEVYSHMGAKNTENMTQELEKERERKKNTASKKWKCVLLVIWGEISTEKKKKEEKK